MQFNQGEPYLRLKNGNMSTMFIPDEDVEPSHTNFGKTVILEVQDGVARNLVYHAYECGYPGRKVGVLQDEVLSFRAPTDEDLRTILMCLPRTSRESDALHQWIKSICNQTNLTTNEKERLQRIAAEIQ